MLFLYAAFDIFNAISDEHDDDDDDDDDDRSLSLYMISCNAACEYGTCPSIKLLLAPGTCSIFAIAIDPP